MARIDLVALQQRMAQQRPKPVPAEPPSWNIRPAPASPLRTTPAPKAPAAASAAAAPAGTLRATTTMRAALPLKATNARAERAAVKTLRAQIDELKDEMAVANAEAERALVGERQRADRLNKQVETLSAEVVRAKKQAEAVVGRAERVEADRDAERAQAEALRTAIDELKTGQALMVEMHAATSPWPSTMPRRCRSGLRGRLRRTWNGWRDGAEPIALLYSDMSADR
jgi:hypothetical protein